MKVESFGTGSCGDGSVVEVSRLRIGAAPGVVLDVLDLGATVHRLEVTCGDDVRRNIVLGHPTAQDYLDSTHYLGAAIGRYANRIRGGSFQLDGVSHQVGAHDRGNSLHGGPDGFDQRIWSVLEHGPDRVRLGLVSADGDQGFPGELRAEVTYTVSGESVLIELSATTDAPTVVNLTDHSYIDLAGEGSGSAMEQTLTVQASHYLPVDTTGIPLEGPPQPVDGTPFDLRLPTPVGQAARADHPQVRDAHGIDHNLVLDGEGHRLAAALESATTRTRLEVWTDAPGLQVYSGNFLDGTTPGTSGGLYRQGDGVALEPQAFPDTPRRPDFGTALLRPGEKYRRRIEWWVTEASLSPPA